MTARLRTLLGDLPPEPTAADVVEHLPLAELAGAERPYVAVNMIASADGRASLDGRAGPLGNQADRELLLHLRCRADAVLVGANTVRVEGYGELVPDGLRPLRARFGTRPEPLLVLASRRLDLATEWPAFQRPDAEIVVVTSSSETLPPAPARVTYLRLPLAEALRALRADHGVRAVVCEGGPRLNASVLPSGLADELFLAVAPMLVGGPDPLTVLVGDDAPEAVPLELHWLLESEGTLFARYAVVGNQRSGKAG